MIRSLCILTLIKQKARRMDIEYNVLRDKKTLTTESTIVKPPDIITHDLHPTTCQLGHHILHQICSRLISGLSALSHLSPKLFLL